MSYTLYRLWGFRQSRLTTENRDEVTSTATYSGIEPRSMELAVVFWAVGHMTYFSSLRPIQCLKHQGSPGSPHNLPGDLAFALQPSSLDFSFIDSRFARFFSNRCLLRDGLAYQLRKQAFVAINYRFPVVALAHSRLRALSVGIDERFIFNDALKLTCQIICIHVGNGGLARDLQVLRCGEGEHTVAVAHRFDERRVRAADFCRVDVAVRVLL